MSKTEGYTIRPGTVDDLPAVLPMWRELYRIEREMGMAYPLREDADQVWLAEAQRRIGTPNYLLLVAVAPDQSLVGFHTAQIRRRPAIYAEPLVATVVEMFVSEAHRGAGLAKKMLLSTAKQWAERGLAHLEVQVVAGNVAARQFYARAGMQEDLIQFRLDLRELGE